MKNLFKLRAGTPSDTHDKLRCERCETIVDNAENETIRVLPKQLAACKELLEIMSANEDAAMFLTPLIPVDHGISSETYDKAVKQPIDLGTIRAKLNAEIAQSSSYNSASAFSKDVNRIFTNVVKVWEPGQEIADASRRLQSWWMEQWTELVPRLMTMKPDEENKENLNPDQSPEDDQMKCAFVHNERGNNYQDQIGMPDEENMRHWSHHHGSDTVDDPVFRAAMRGYDSVSFVFGLEVTWSLIQQRQQEEDEKKAMLELECIEELEGNDESNEGNESAVNKKDRIQGENDNPDQNEEDKKAELIDITESQETATDDSSDDSISDIVVTEKSDFNETFDELTPTKASESTLEVNATSSSEKKRQSPRANTWNCSECTFENKAKAKKCSMCGNKKSPKKLKL